MTVSRSLSVILQAQTGQFTAGMKKAGASVGKFSRGVASGIGTLAKWTTGIGLAAAAVGAYAAKQAAASIDATGKLSDRLGVQTEKLIGLQHAAEQTGTGVGAMNDSLEMMSRRLGEAREGSGEAAETLQRLGLNTEEFLNKRPDQQFGLIADAINGLGTQQEKAAAAADIFGRSGTKLLNTLELGSAGLADMQSETEKLGLTLSRVDAKKVENANDALNNVRKVIAGGIQKAVVVLSPFIEKIAKKFVDWATSGEGAGAKVVRAIGWVAEGIARAIGFVEKLKGSFFLLKGFAIQVFAELTGILTAPFIAAIDFLNAIPGVDIELGRQIELGIASVKADANAAFAEGGRLIAGADARTQEVRDLFDRIAREATTTAQVQVNINGVQDPQGFAQSSRQAIQQTAEELAVVARRFGGTDAAIAGLIGQG